MNRTVLLVLMTASVALACAHVSPLATPSVPLHASVDHSHIVFKVGNSHTSQSLRGVKVSLIASDGSEISLGETDMFGALRVPKDLLREHRARFILFWRERFFTGAIRVDSPGVDFYAYDERYFELAGFAVI